MDFYEKEAPKYDEKRWPTQQGKYVNSVHRTIILGMQENWKNEKILELGVGTGRVTLMIAKRGAVVTGIDSSPTMLEKTRNKLGERELNERIQLINASVYSLPFKNCCFSGCVSINVFSHLPNYENVILEVSRVLKPGGFFVANYPNLISYYLPYGILVNMRRKSLRRPVFTHWYNLHRIRKSYSRQNMRIDEIQGQVHFPAGMKNPILSRVARLLDHISRSSILRYICPTIFIRTIKKEEIELFSVTETV